MQPLRAAVIGVGVMGQRHARVLAELPSFELVAIADLNEERVEGLSRELGVRGYGHFRDLLAAEALDVVAVATADDYHREPAIEVLNRGLGLLLEKPVASSLADAEAIRASASEMGRPVMVGHTLRYDARYQAVATAAREGKLGELIHFYARRNATTWSGARIGGRASVTIFQGVHDFDAIRWISGAEITRVYAAQVSKALRHLGVADTIQATLHLSDGSIAQVEQSWAVPYGVPSMLDARLEVVGTQGAAYVDMTPQCLSLYVDGHYSQPDTIYGVGNHILKDMYARFTACWRGEAEPLASLEDGIAALRVAVAVDESARTGLPIDLAGDA